MKVSQTQYDIAVYDQSLVVVSVPGSGKTLTLVAKISHIIQHSAECVVLVTFTNSAAKELSERLESVIGKDNLANRVVVGTFHALMIAHLEKHTKYKSVSLEDQANYLHRLYYRSFETYDNYDNFEHYFHQYHSKTINKVNPSYEQLIAEYYETIVKDKGISLSHILNSGVDLIKEGQVPLFNCDWLMVDEFQDVDSVQLDLVLLHGLMGKKVAAVGDGDQAIYDWRGSLSDAAFESVINKLNAKMFMLDYNYRSHSEILVLANKLISHNSGRIEKVLKSVKGPGATILARKLPTPYEEAKYIAECLKNHREGDVGIICRTNKRLDVIEEVFAEVGIEYVRNASNNQLTQLCVKVFVALLKGIDYRNVHAIESAIEPIVESHEIAKEIAIYCLKSTSIPIQSKQFQTFANALSEVRELFNHKVYNKGINIIKNHLVPLMSRKGINNTFLIENLAYRLTKLKGNISQRLIMLQSNKSSQSKIELMTAHASKGLQKEIVFICGCNEDIYPMNPKQGKPVNIKEERRLFFVAITRAIRKLVLTCVEGTANKPNYYAISRFFAEMEISTEDIKTEHVENESC